MDNRKEAQLAYWQNLKRREDTLRQKSKYEAINDLNLLDHVVDNDDYHGNVKVMDNRKEAQLAYWQNLKRREDTLRQKSKYEAINDLNLLDHVVDNDDYHGNVKVMDNRKEAQLAYWQNLKRREDTLRQKSKYEAINDLNLLDHVVDNDDYHGNVKVMDNRKEAQLAYWQNLKRREDTLRQKSKYEAINDLNLLDHVVDNDDYHGNVKVMDNRKEAQLAYWQNLKRREDTLRQKSKYEAINDLNLLDHVVDNDDYHGNVKVMDNRKEAQLAYWQNLKRREDTLRQKSKYEAINDLNLLDHVVDNDDYHGNVKVMDNRKEAQLAYWQNLKRREDTLRQKSKYEAINDLNLLDHVVDNDDYHGNVKVMDNRKEAQLAYWQNLKRREDTLRQKSKCKWLKERDRNSKLFQSFM
ncbi:hypothetical protein KIW84_061041 [Lathyrus oleraceus]|uniref:Uncharacterized protein n=1 Tax=Pisum sativum TaxID=3888 RepID=A0A9D5A654_PEA|nr:hypothetical protein KIW84_061041 [Pisum sativum]